MPSGLFKRPWRSWRAHSLRFRSPRAPLSCGTAEVAVVMRQSTGTCSLKHMGLPRGGTQMPSCRIVGDWTEGTCWESGPKQSGLEFPDGCGFRKEAGSGPWFLISSPFLTHYRRATGKHTNRAKLNQKHSDWTRWHTIQWLFVNQQGWHLTNNLKKNWRVHLHLFWLLIANAFELYILNFSSL